MTTTKPLTLVIDSDLWYSFKATVTRERTLNDAVVELIRECVEKKGVEKING